MKEVALAKEDGNRDLGDGENSGEHSLGMMKTPEKKIFDSVGGFGSTSGGGDAWEWVLVRLLVHDWVVAVALLAQSNDGEVAGLGKKMMKRSFGHDLGHDM